MIEEPIMPAGEAPAPTEQGLEGGRRPSSCCWIERSLAWLESVRPGWGVEIGAHIAILEIEKQQARLIAERATAALDTLVQRVIGEGREPISLPWKSSDNEIAVARQPRANSDNTKNL